MIISKPSLAKAFIWPSNFFVKGNFKKTVIKKIKIIIKKKEVIFFFLE